MCASSTLQGSKITRRQGCATSVLIVLIDDLLIYKPVLASAGTIDTWDNLYSFFLGRVRDKLHVCLCFSPVGAKFSRRAQQFPGLINGCTIDWFLSWPEEALTSVSGKFIDEFPMACPDSVKDSLKAMMGQVHINVTAACQEYFDKFRRHVYVTPKSYLSFIAGYKSLYEKKLVYVRELATSINSGLSKMGEAKVDVNKMKGELAIKNTDLAAATKEAEKLLKEISENTAIAEKEKQKVSITRQTTATSHHALKPEMHDMLDMLFNQAAVCGCGHILVTTVCCDLLLRTQQKGLKRSKQACGANG